jgi:DNA-binding response OmpR family regulator
MPATVMHAFYDTASVPPLSALPSTEGNGGPLSVLVVEPDLSELLSLSSMLSATGFHVTAAASFAQARVLIGGARAFAVLLTTLRLGMYNGLHLVVRGRWVQPTMAALVLASPEDALLQTEAERLGATFMVKPTTARECIAAILQTVFRRDPASGPVRAPFERRAGERRASPETIAHDRRRSDRRRTIPWLVPIIAD